MTYPESELWTGIQARLLDAAVASHYTDNGHVAPVTFGIYNRQYEDAEEKLPFNRPGVFLEIGSYEGEDKGGYLRQPIPLVLHIVQDCYVEGYSTLSAGEVATRKDLLKYPVIIQDLLHRHRIYSPAGGTKGGVILDTKGMDPDHDHKNLLVHKLRMRAIVRKLVNS